MTRLPARQIGSYAFDPELTPGKMILLSGPRQVGKSTWAKSLAKGFHSFTYSNWDDPSVRARYAADPLFFLKGFDGRRSHLAVFDEIHKRPRWKDILKGAFDPLDRERVRLLVTGSARLRWFRRSGDSLAGRYVHFSMLPLSVSEVLGSPVEKAWLLRESDWVHPWSSLSQRMESLRAPAREAFNRLSAFGGFPEPFLRGSERFGRRWRLDYLDLLLREDLRDLSRIADLDRVERLARLLPDRVGSPVSMNALARDIETSAPTVRNDLSQLERLWLLFRVPPWHRKVARALRKEAKAYFTDWGQVPTEGPRFENLVAVHLLKTVTLLNELALGEAGLHYVRTFDGREADFLLVLDGKPVLLVEAKTSDSHIDAHLHRIAGALDVPILQVVQRPGIWHRHSDRAWAVSAERFLAQLA